METEGSPRTIRSWASGDLKNSRGFGGTTMAQAQVHSQKLQLPSRAETPGFHGADGCLFVSAPPPPQLAVFPFIHGFPSNQPRSSSREVRIRVPVPLFLFAREHLPAKRVRALLADLATQKRRLVSYP